MLFRILYKTREASLSPANLRGQARGPGSPCTGGSSSRNHCGNRVPETTPGLAGAGLGRGGPPPYNHHTDVVLLAVSYTWVSQIYQTFINQFVLNGLSNMLYLTVYFS